MLSISTAQSDTVLELYSAYFNRAADEKGFAFWKGSFSKYLEGTNSIVALQKIALDMSASLEYQALYPSTQSTTEFVSAIYRNLLNRSSDSEGLNFWVRHIDRGTLSKEMAIINMISGAKENTTDQGQLDAALIVNKNATSKYFAEKLKSNDVPLAKTVFDGITSDFNTVGNTINFLGNTDKSTLNSQTLINAQNSFNTTIENNITINNIDNSVTTINVINKTIDTVDADDYSQDTATTGLINIGETIEGVIEKRADEDWFKTKFTLGESYSISGNAHNKLHLKLRDSNGREILTPQDSTEISVDFTPTESGLYYVSIAYPDSSVGNYSVGIKTIIIDDYTNDTGTTGSITAGKTSTGKFESVNDSDWFKTELLSGESYIFTEKSEEKINNFNLRDENGGYVNIQAYSEGESRAFKFTPEESGTYYLDIGGDNGEYAVELKINKPIITDDYADNINTTGTITAGKTSTGKFESVNDSDWFKTQLISEDVYRFTTSSSSDSLRLRVYNEQGELIDQSLNTNNPSIDFKPTNSGDYYLSLEGDQGTYTVGVEEYLRKQTGRPQSPIIDDYGNDTNTTGQLIINAQATNGKFETKNDSDWFKIDLTQGQDYLINYKSHDVIAIMEVMNKDGQIMVNDLGFSSLLRERTFTPTESDEYYISIRDINGLVSQNDPGEYYIFVTSTTPPEATFL